MSQGLNSMLDCPYASKTYNLTSRDQYFNGKSNILKELVKRRDVSLSIMKSNSSYFKGIAVYL